MAERPTPVPRGTTPAQQAAPTEPVEKAKGPLMHRVTVDLGTSTDHMKINDVEYWHGQTYMVPDERAPGTAESFRRASAARLRGV